MRLKSVLTIRTIFFSVTFMKKNIYNACTFFLVSFFVCLFVACGVSDAEGNEYSKWSLSGFVVDGVDNIPLTNAILSYSNEEGDLVEVKTDSAGAFFIEALPYGSKAFTISYTYKDKKDTVVYGSRRFIFSSTSESNTMEGVVANGARIIRLFPLNASLSGELYFVEDDTKKQIPAKEVTINVLYSDSSFVNIKESSFTTKTDSLGVFNFSNLPADSGLSLFFTSTKYKNIRYTLNSQKISRLIPQKSLNLGRFLMIADSVMERESFVLSSNVLDEYGNGLYNVSPSIEPYFVLKESLNSENLKVVLSYGKGDSIFPVQLKMNKDTLFLKHILPLPVNQTFSVEIIGYVKSSGERIQISLKNRAAFETSSGLMIRSSNVDPNFSSYKASFAIGDTMWLCFSEKLSTNLDRIGWSSVSNADVSLYGYGSKKNVDAWVKQDTLFIKNLPVIETRDSAEVGDLLGASMTVYSASGLSLSGITFLTQLAP